MVGIYEIELASNIFTEMVHRIRNNLFMIRNGMILLDYQD
jgi:hypothetical protein